VFQRSFRSSSTSLLLSPFANLLAPQSSYSFGCFSLGSIFRMRTIITTSVCFITLAVIASGQTTKRNERPTDPKPSATPQVPQPTPTPTGKRNERPQTPSSANGNGPTQTVRQTVAKPAYVYEFTRPDFVVPYVLIEHDESGRGKISFKMRGLDDA
jgi:hypothetical protein